MAHDDFEDPSGGTRVERADPELVVLEPRAGQSAKAPVRIFLGTEDAQLRAERIFFYSIERVRDPGRRYEVYLMKNLAGFSTRHWRTQFTNYRFAIPDFAGREGKAIYNDVDEIYLTDPAELFDLDMRSHGYLSVTPSETSVMLIDCARMVQWWNRERAQRRTKAELLAAASAERGIWGALAAEWNARDMEYVEGRSKCVHFTALHTQPWQPSPEQYSYHHHPLADVWDRLERAADAQRYQVFGPGRPSADFACAAAAARDCPPDRHTPLTASAKQWLSALPADSLLRCSFGIPTPDPLDPVPAVPTDRDCAASPQLPQGELDAVVAVDLLEKLSIHDVPWMLDELFTRARKGVLASVACPTDATGSSPRSPEWWRAQMASAAHRRTGLAWRLELFRETSQQMAAAYEAPSPAETPQPRVWLLFGNKTGDNQQIASLADALGWPYEIKKLYFNSLRHVPSLLVDKSLATLDAERSDRLEAPWPDVVITVGKRTVPVARWIRARSGEHTRLVHIGRPWAPLSWFDLIITTPQYGLPARPNVLHNTMPLNRVAAERLAGAEQRTKLREALETLPSPRIAVLVGGNSTSHVMTDPAAKRLGAEASRLANNAGGSLLITTSPRTPDSAVAALRMAVKSPVLFQMYGSDESHDTYQAFLAVADAFIVTGDSASMLAEACSTGKPVHIFPLPHRYEQVPGARPLLELIRSWRTGGTTPRGTPKQQDLISRTYDRLVDLGIVTPPRDLEAYHEALELRGLATRIGTHAEPISPSGPDDLARAVERVRELLHSERRLAV